MIIKQFDASSMKSTLQNYVLAFDADSKFIKRRYREVLFPINFVTITMLKNREELVISLRGKPEEFLEQLELPIHKGRGKSYSEVRVTNNSQINAVTNYIRRARNIALRGQSRQKTSLALMEIPIKSSGEIHA